MQRENADMRNFLQNLAVRMQRFMIGRYGGDEFTKFLMISSCVMIVLSCFSIFRFLYLPALIVMGYSIYRSYSRNIYKRQAELAKYLQLRNSVRSYRQLQRKKYAERKTHKYIKCPHCRKTFRVPKGKGRIKISCPYCRSEIIEKT